jgi:hypothetical protein
MVQPFLCIYVWDFKAGTWFFSVLIIHPIYAGSHVLTLQSIATSLLNTGHQVYGYYYLLFMSHHCIEKGFNWRGVSAEDKMFYVPFSQKNYGFFNFQKKNPVSVVS